MPTVTTIKNIARSVAYQHLYPNEALVQAAHTASHLPMLQQRELLRLIAESEPPIGKAPRSRYVKRIVLRVREKARTPWTDVANAMVCFNRMFLRVESMVKFFEAVMSEARVRKKENIKIVTTCRLHKYDQVQK